MTTPILKTPIYYKPNSADQYKDSGGESTSLIELPTQYAIGGYAYSKENLNPIKNGSIGILSEGGDYNQAQVYNNEGVNYRAILPISGYYSGAQFRFSTVNNTAIGTLGRKVSAIPYIRDIQDSNIVYLMLSPSMEEPRKFVTLARYNQNNQDMEWRIYLDCPIINSTEYLFQDINNLYFMTSYALTTISQYNDSNWTNRMYIISVNKMNSNISIVSTFTQKDINNNASDQGNAFWRYLGFINQNEFLFEYCQCAFPYSSSSNNNPAIKDDTSFNFLNNLTNITSNRYIVKYNTKNNNYKVIYDIKETFTPATYSGTQNNFTVFGSNIVDNGQFVIHAINTFNSEVHNSYAYIADMIKYIKYSETKDEILNEIKMKVFSSYNKPNVIMPCFKFRNEAISSANPFIATNLFDFETYYSNGTNTKFGVINSNDYFSLALKDNNNKDKYQKIIELGRYGEYFTIMNKINDFVTNNNGNFFLTRSYDIVKSTREKQVLRINSISLNNKSKANIVTGKYFKASGTIETERKNQILDKDKYNRRIHMLGYDFYSSKASTINPKYYSGFKSNNSNSLMTSQQIFNENTDSTSNYVYTIPERKLPLTLEFRRSYNKPGDNPIYLNGKGMPIYLKGYTMAIFKKSVDYVPLEWNIEAHDIKTNKWILIDSKTNQKPFSIAFPNQDPRYNSPTSILDNFNIGNNNNDITQNKIIKNFYEIKDFREKCPEGAYSVRVTFTKSADIINNYVTFRDFSFIEEQNNEYQEITPSNSNQNFNDTNGWYLTFTNCTQYYNSNINTNSTATYKLFNGFFFNNTLGKNFDGSEMGIILNPSTANNVNSPSSTTRPAMTMTYMKNKANKKAKVDGIQVCMPANVINTCFPDSWEIFYNSDDDDNVKVLVKVTPTKIEFRNPEYNETNETLIDLLDRINRYGNTVRKAYFKFLKTKITKVNNYKDDLEKVAKKAIFTSIINLINKDVKDKSKPDFTREEKDEDFTTNESTSNILKSIEDYIKANIDKDFEYYYEPKNLTDRINCLIVILNDMAEDKVVNIVSNNEYILRNITNDEEGQKKILALLTLCNSNIKEITSNEPTKFELTELSTFNADNFSTKINKIMKDLFDNLIELKISHESWKFYIGKDSNPEFITKAELTEGTFTANDSSAEVTAILNPLGKTYIFTFDKSYISKRIGIRYAKECTNKFANNSGSYWALQTFIPFTRVYNLYDEYLNGDFTTDYNSENLFTNNINENNLYQSIVSVINKENDISFTSFNCNNGDSSYNYSGYYQLGNGVLNPDKLPSITFTVGNYYFNKKFNKKLVDTDYNLFYSKEFFADSYYYANNYKLIGYEFILPTNMDEIYIKKWKFYGSNDRENWKVIDKREYKIDDYDSKKHRFTIQSPGYYRYYKFEIEEISEDNLNKIYLMSINTFFANPTNRSDLTHTVTQNMFLENWTEYPEDYTYGYNKNVDVKLISGEFLSNNEAYLNKRSYYPIISLGYKEKKIVFEYDIDRNNTGIKLPVNNLNIILNSSMEVKELPSTIKVYGNNTNDNWTEDNLILNLNGVKYDDSYIPYELNIDLEKTYNYRYYRIEFSENNLPIGNTFEEQWLVASTTCNRNDEFIVGDTSSDTTQQVVFKITPEKHLTLTGVTFRDIYGNMWLNDRTWAQVCASNIYIKRINPIIQNMETVRTIPAIGACINACCTDSNNNIWIWGNSSHRYGNRSNNAIDNYCYIALQPAYGEQKVVIEPETNYKIYEGESASTYVKVWIENSVSNEKMAGKIKVTLDGFDAKFVKNNKNEIEVVTTKEEPIAKLDIKSDNPSRVNITAYIING